MVPEQAHDTVVEQRHRMLCLQEGESSSLSMMARRLVRSPAFIHGITAVIVINLVVLGIEVSWTAVQMSSNLTMLALQEKLFEDASPGKSM